MKPRQRTLAYILAFPLTVFLTAVLVQQYRYKHLRPSQRAEEIHFIASSTSWVDRQLCGLLGFCGVYHLKEAAWATTVQTLLHDVGGDADEQDHYEDFWQSGNEDPSTWSDDDRILRDIPQYIIDHAPLIHLYSGEEYWPCDIAEHLQHTTPYRNYTPVTSDHQHENLSSLSRLNEYGRGIFLHSDDNIEDKPKWLSGAKNIPRRVELADHQVVVDEEPMPYDELPFDDTLGYDNYANKESWSAAGSGNSEDNIQLESSSDEAVKLDPIRLPGDGEPLTLRQRSVRDGLAQEAGRSTAPAVLVAVEKGEGVVDAFWFHFYSYNQGNTVFNVRFGNHVGDWEHTCIRFQHGEPKAVYFSEHSSGEAYSYAAVEKIGKRVCVGIGKTPASTANRRQPVGYSARGTHAMYATPAVHRYILPFGLLHDITDRGPLWDPSLNMYSYRYNYTSRTILSSVLTPKAPTEWFYFTGHWGDKTYPLSDKRQYRFAGQYHYISGPMGPMYKNLGREHICGRRGECKIKDRIGDKDSAAW